MPGGAANENPRLVMRAAAKCAEEQREQTAKETTMPALTLRE